MNLELSKFTLKDFLIFRKEFGKKSNKFIKDLQKKNKESDDEEEKKTFLK